MIQLDTRCSVLPRVIQENVLIAKSIKIWNQMLDYKLIVIIRQFRWFFCAVGMRSSKTRDQP